MMVAPWQLVSINGKDFTVCKSFNNEGYFYVLEDGNYYHVNGPHLHGEQQYDLDKPGELCIGCATCNEWKSCNYTPGDADEFQCIHGKALVSYLTKKRDHKGPKLREFTAGLSFEVRIEE